MQSIKELHSKTLELIIENNYIKAKKIFEKIKDDDLFAQFYIYICDKEINQTSFKIEKEITLKYVKIFKKNFLKYQNELETNKDTETKYILGKLYCIKSMGKYYDLDKGTQLLRRAAKDGFVLAQVEYSQLLRREYLTKDNLTEVERKEYIENATLYLQKAVDQDYGIAHYLIAECYSYGHLGFKINQTSAMKHYKEGAKHNAFICNTDIASRILMNPNIKDKSEAVDYLLKASKYKYPRSDRFLSLCYFYGLGIEKDEQKAIFYARRSFRNNHIQSALILYNIFKELGNIRLSNKYGKLYYQNLKYLKASHHMRMFYYEHIATCFFNGIGTRKNTLRAIEYYKKGALECSYTDCMIKLSSIYFDNNTKYYNISLALKYLKMASDKNDSTADYLLGDYYKNTKNLKEAKKYFIKASDNNYPQALYEIGMIYSRENKSRQALDYLQKALNSGIEQAKYEIDRIESKYIGKVDNIKDLNNDSLKLINDKLNENNVSEQAKSAINTALLIYQELVKLNNDSKNLIDYSPVITLLSKAIEIEFKKYFKIEFIKYLINKGITPLEMSKNAKGLTIEIDKKYNQYSYDTQSENPFTMGEIVHTIDVSKVATKVQYENIDYKYSLASANSENKRFIFNNKYFIDYLDSIFKRNAFSINTRRIELLQYLYILNSNIYFLKDYLRNSAVHSSIMSKYDANLAINLIVLTQEILFSFKEKLEDNYK